VRKDFVSVKPLTTKVALLSSVHREYLARRMNTFSIHEAASNPAQRYPRGRWTSAETRLATRELQLGALSDSLNSDDSALASSSPVRPPFETAMDHPMPDAA